MDTIKIDARDVKFWYGDFQSYGIPLLSSD